MCLFVCVLCYCFVWFCCLNVFDGDVVCGFVVCVGVCVMMEVMMCGMLGLCLVCDLLIV